ncbi:MAG: rane protein [Bacillales bacterium]|jgi:uncharacterized membrane protein YczE|nr:rane protein [Bacillales bacterium]
MQFFNKNFNMRLLKRITIFIMGTVFIALGIALTYKAQSLGTGAFDALNLGLSKTFGLEAGDWVLIMGVIIIILNSFLEKQFPKILSAIPVILIGQFLNLWMKVFNQFQLSGNVQLILILMLGVAVLSFGVALYILPSFPPSPIDLLTLTLMNKLKWTFRKTKTYVEIIALVLALFFHGPIWIGTIFITLFIGPFIQSFLKILKKPYLYFVK